MIQVYTTPAYKLKGIKSAYIKYFCTPMFIVVLFRIAKLWYQPSTNEWIKKM
jgi:hypothetical protein